MGVGLRVIFGEERGGVGRDEEKMEEGMRGKEGGESWVDYVI